MSLLCVRRCHANTLFQCCFKKNMDNVRLLLLRLEVLYWWHTEWDQLMELSGMLWCRCEGNSRITVDLQMCVLMFSTRCIKLPFSSWDTPSSPPPPGCSTTGTCFAVCACLHKCACVCTCTQTQRHASKYTYRIRVLCTMLGPTPAKRCHGDYSSYLN